MLAERLPAVLEPGEATHPRAGRGPVLLATLEVPFDGRATRIAVDAAVESGLPLTVANIVRLPLLPMSVLLGYDQLEYPAELEAALVAPAVLALSLGVEAERLRVRSPRPVEAVLQLAAERTPGLLVFGPDRSLLRRRTYEKAARRIREHVSALVWLAPG